MQPCFFLLYCLSLLVGLAGLVVGGCPVIEYVVQRLSGSYNSDYDALFRFTVIFLLSLILLILVHLGHRLAGAFDVGLPKKPETPEPAQKSDQ